MNILFFASLREQLKTDQEAWTDMHGITTAKELVDHLKQRGEPWQSAFTNTKIIISVNQEVADLSTTVTLNDEVAFFPPVTGG